MINVIIFGTGTGMRKILKHLNYSNVNLVTFVDNDITKQGNFIESIKIINPKEIENYFYDYIIIASDFYDNITKQLLLLGILPEKIIKFYNYSDIFINSLIDGADKFVNNKEIYNIFDECLENIRM